MREALRQVKPTEFEDLIALVALYRPGPMAYIPVYARRKAGQEQVTFADERLRADHRPDLRDLHLPGAVHGDREAARRLLACRGRRSPQGDRQEDPLADGVAARTSSSRAASRTASSRRSPSSSGRTWSRRRTTRSTSRTRPATPSSRTGPRTCKANHPAEYMAALISSVMNTKDRVPFYVSACEEMGIEVLPPDVNVSASDFAVVEGKIRFGLNAVKNVGENAVEAIIAARATAGPFVSLWDFCERVDPQVVNKRALESLVKSGALDSTRGSRQGMLARARAGARARQPLPRRPAHRTGLDLRPRITGRRGRHEARAPAPAHRRRRSSRSPSCWPSRRSRSACGCRSTRSRECARR